MILYTTCDRRCELFDTQIMQIVYCWKEKKNGGVLHQISFDCHRRSEFNALLSPSFILLFITPLLLSFLLYFYFFLFFYNLISQHDNFDHLITHSISIHGTKSWTLFHSYHAKIWAFPRPLATLASPHFLHVKVSPVNRSNNISITFCGFCEKVLVQFEMENNVKTFTLFYYINYLIFTFIQNGE